MALEDRKQWVETHRDLPGATSDGAAAPVHGTRFGEVVNAPLYGAKNYALADEGSYFVATNPTPGTAIAGIAAADGLDDTEALLFIRNTATAAEGYRVYLDYIRLRVAAAGTNGTDFAYAMKLDTGTTRYASGGSTITPVNTSMQSTRTAPLTMVFGAVVPTAASSSARLVSHGSLRSVIKVIGDTYTFAFGQTVLPPLSAATTAGTAIAHEIIGCPPVVLGPTDQFLLHEFAASQTVAAQYQFEIGFWVR